MGESLQGSTAPSLRLFIALIVVGVCTASVGVLLRGPSPAAFRDTVEQPYYVQAHLLSLWQLRKDCDKADFGKFQRDALLLGELTGTSVIVRLEPDNSVDVSVRKDTKTGEIVVGGGDYSALNRLGAVEKVCRRVY
jgi:hypothetical protein